MGPGDLAETLNGLKLYRPDNLLVGFETGDDAGVFDIGDRYLVQTVDFITPVVDDPYQFGQIAALNSISDVYAMGGRPITAMSVFAYNCGVDSSDIKAMMQGAADELGKIECTLLGGHTVEDAEIKLGFSITGEITDKRIYKNVGLREGDILIYTKPLGIGLVSTALKAGLASEEHIKEVTETMLLSNKEASEIMKKFDCSACTDITGFGLAGHAYEMASGSNVSVEFFKDSAKVIDGTKDYASQFIIPAGAYSNMEFLNGKCTFETATDNSHMIYFDPQTSGGLLIGVSEKDSEKMLRALKDSGYSNSVSLGATAKATPSLGDKSPKACVLLS